MSSTSEQGATAGGRAMGCYAVCPSGDAKGAECLLPPGHRGRHANGTCYWDATGGRVITRADWARLAIPLDAALGVKNWEVRWSATTGLVARIDERVNGGWFTVPMGDARLARAGIVPGPDGWRWASTPVDGPVVVRVGAPDPRGLGVGKHDAPDGGVPCSCGAWHRVAPTVEAIATTLGADIERVQIAWVRGERDDQALFARAGVVPGLRGWKWAGGAPDAAQPPAWLTTAVLAALPPSGEVRSLMDLHNSASVSEYPRCRDSVPAVLAHLVSTGEIEACDGGWRRWGVPEGWGWVDVHNDGSRFCLARGVGMGMVAAVTARDGAITWMVGRYNGDDDNHSAPSLAAARTAALRACYERGVFGPRPAVEGARVRLTADALIGGLAAPAPGVDRAAAVRQALLAVLSHGPVTTGTATLLPAVEAAMGAPAGSVEGREAREAARAVGAVVDGARWSLPEMVPGWGWRHVNGADLLTRMDAVRPDDDAVAIIQRDSVGNALGWKLLPDGEQWWAPSVVAAQAAALAAARRAGLFARPVPAVEVASDGGSPVLPAVTSQSSEAVYYAPHGPLDAAVLAILATASPAEITAHLKAWGAALVAEARAPRHTIDAVGEQDGGVMTVGVPHAVVEASLAARAYAADAPLLYRVWQAAQRVREATAVAGDDPLDEAVGSLVAVLDAAEREGHTPREPRPHRDGNEEPWETIEQLARERDDARQELAAMEVHADEQRQRAKEAERDARTWQAREAEARTHGDEARAMLAQVIEQRDAAEQRADKAEASLARVERGIEEMAAGLRAERGVGR